MSIILNTPQNAGLVRYLQTRVELLSKKPSLQSPPPDPWYRNQEALFLLGAAAWLLAMLLRWPTTLSFGDEIGYLGQTKLFFEGRLHPRPVSRAGEMGAGHQSEKSVGRGNEIVD